MKDIVGQVSIHRLLITELGDFLIEVYSDPGMMGSSFPLLLHRGLSFAHAADRSKLLSLLHYDKNKKITEIWEPENQKKARK